MSSFIGQLESLLQKSESGAFSDAWRSKLRRSILPVLLMYACGTEEAKKKPGDDPTVEESPTPTSAPTTPSSTTTKQKTKSLEDQLKERGWGCEIEVARPTMMSWTFTKTFPADRNVRRNQESFSIVFRRESETDPWDFSSPSNVVPPQSSTPEMQALRQEVLDAMEYGSKYIAKNYECYVANPRNLEI